MKTKISLPSSHTILLIIAAFVAIASWFIPSGKYDMLQYDAQKNIFTHSKDTTVLEYPATQKTLDSLNIKIALSKFKDGSIWKAIGIPGTYHETSSRPQGVLAFIKSPLKGITDSIDVILFVLIIGGFIGIINYTGTFEAGIQQLAKTLEGREKILIIIITSLIALGGTSFGLAEETIAFYPILVPVFLAARYDAIVALASIYIGSSIGTMVSTINPFSAIIASNAAGINWTNGLYGRVIMLVISTAICIWYIIRYAEKVRKNPQLSIIYHQKEAIEKQFLKNSTDKIDFNYKRIITIVIFFLSFVLMIYGVSNLQWWFMEMTMIFFVASILVGFVCQIKEKKFIEEFIKGANDLLGVALIIGIARGISWLMEESSISSTLLYYSSLAVEGMPKGIFINLMLFLYAGLSFFIPSSSGLAVLSMPIMAPLSDVVDIPREIVVNAYQYGMGLMAFITPTGLILASLTMVNVGYNKWLKFILPLLLLLTILTMAVLTIQVYFSI